MRSMAREVALVRAIKYGVAENSFCFRKKICHLFTYKYCLNIIHFSTQYAKKKMLMGIVEQTVQKLFRTYLCISYKFYS